MADLLSLYDAALLALWFFAYSFAGWVWEVAYSAVEHRRFVNRGFLFGPVVPIYGAGALVAIVAVGPLPNVAAQFAAACALATVIEYGTSWVMERLFNARWWDYSDKPFNLHGRICLGGILLFGVMMLAVVHVFQPALEHAAALIAPTAAVALAGVLTCVFIIDLTVTVVRMQAFAHKLELLESRLSLLALAARTLADEARATALEKTGDMRDRLGEMATGLADDARNGMAAVRSGVQDTREALADTRATLARDARQARDDAAQTVLSHLEALRAKLGDKALREIAEETLRDLPGLLPRPTWFERRTGRDPYFRPTRNNGAFEWFRDKVLGERKK